MPNALRHHPSPSEPEWPAWEPEPLELPLVLPVPSRGHTPGDPQEVPEPPLSRVTTFDLV
jgi:hypothetical protein